jgi:hypothetical protein
MDRNGSTGSDKFIVLVHRLEGGAPEMELRNFFKMKKNFV